MASGLKVGELYGVLSLDTAPFDRDLNTAHAQFASAGEGLLGKAAVLAGGLGAALGGADLVKKVADMGIEFQDLGHTWEAVTRGPMAAMQQKAIELGNDLSLPATSAGDAEDAMVELAKGGLSAAEAMDAAKGTLQLAAAANVSAGDAAVYSADALNTFHLKGKDAVMVADLLAAAANASSGEITDMGDSLQQAGSVFAAAHIPIQTTVTLISELAQNGIRGSDAGTSLKTMLISLQNPTSQAAALIKQLNLNLYDSHGRVRDFRDIIQGAQGPLSKLTQQQRDQALATVFGTDAVRAANIVFGSGVQAYDDMATAVTKSGVAADVAGARSKGLGGALRGLQSQAETLGLKLFQEVSPRVEGFVRAASDKFPAVQDLIAAGLQHILDVAGKLDPIFARLGKLIGDLDDLAKKGDWKAFGERLGKALVSAVEETAGLPAAVAKLVMKAFDQIDWYELGTKAAPAFEGFALAFATEAMNPNLWVKAIGKHPVEGLLGVASLATIIFGPEELIGVKLAEFLSRIPLVGSILAWIVRSLNKTGGPGRAIAGFFGDIFKGVGKGIEDALDHEEGAILGGVQGIVRTALKGLDDLKTGFYTVGEEAMQFLGRGIGSVLKDVRTEVLKVVNAADEILTFLVTRAGDIGYNAITTLKTGMMVAWDTVSGWVAGIAGRIASLITTSGLWERGAAILQSFLDGLKSRWKDVTDFVGGIASWIAEHKGPLEVDRVLLRPHGQAVMAGFHEGLIREWSSVQATIGGFNAALAGPALVPATAGAHGSAGAAGMQSAGRTVVVHQHFNGSWPSDHHKMLSDAAWEARRLR